MMVANMPLCSRRLFGPPPRISAPEEPPGKYYRPPQPAPPQPPHFMDGLHLLGHRLENLSVYRLPRFPGTEGFAAPI